MTQTTKMTIHRALSELKLMDDKISKQINELNPVGIYQKDKLIFNYVKPEDFTSQAQSKYDSINDLIARKQKIKSAIVQANGVTKLTIAGKEMTIADAINFKAVIAFKKNLLARMKQSHMAAFGDMNKNNAVVETNVTRLLEATFGKDVKVDPADAEAIRKPYMEANKFHLHDPLDVLKKAEAMDKEIADFTVEVDAALSEINAVTFIEI